MDGKLIFTKLNKRSCAFLIQNGKMLAASLQGEEEDDEKVTGGIYIARIKDVVKELNACFAETEKDKICFLSGTETFHPFYLSDDIMKQKNRKPKPGDLILVQGLREAQKTKQPAVTTKISVANRFFVISLGFGKTGFSSKLTQLRKQQLREELLGDERFFDQKGNMKHWSQMDLEPFEYAKAFPQTGLIFRTECWDVPTEVLRMSLQGLIHEFYGMLKAACYRTAFTCLKTPPRPWQAAINHFALPGEYDEILTDDSTLYKEIAESGLVPSGKSIRLYTDKELSLNKLYGLTSKLNNALSRRVWLKSGAYLIIEPTEALTVIDVNSGKYEAHKGEKDFYRNINLEAAQEIAYQIRLRNLSGMILVDFINMSDSEDQGILIKEMERLTQQDRVKTCVIDFTKLGLMEITRQKTVPPLMEQAIRFEYPLPKK